MEFVLNNLDSAANKLAQYGRNVWNISGDDDTEVAKKAIAATYDFFKNSLEIPMTLPEVGIENDEHFSEMAKEAVRVGGLDTDSPYVKLSAEDIEKLFNESLTETNY
jgi:alcohol dehydrogenase YqhD (iron-dependent ADH family)